MREPVRGHHRRRSSGPRLHRQPPPPLRRDAGPLPGLVQPALRRVLDGHRLRVGGGRGPRQRDLRPQVRARLRRRDLLSRHLRHTPAAVRAPHGGVGDRRPRARRSAPGAQPLHDASDDRAAAAPDGGGLGLVPRPDRRGRRRGPGARLRHTGAGRAHAGDDGHGVVQLEALRRLLPRHRVIRAHRRKVPQRGGPPRRHVGRAGRLRGLPQGQPVRRRHHRPGDCGDRRAAPHRRRDHRDHVEPGGRRPRHHHVAGFVGPAPPRHPSRAAGPAHRRPRD